MLIISCKPDVQEDTTLIPEKIRFMFSIAIACWYSAGYFSMGTVRNKNVQTHMYPISSPTQLFSIAWRKSRKYPELFDAFRSAVITAVSAMHARKFNKYQ